MDVVKAYKSREQAGEVLAEQLVKLNLKKPYLLAIPRGGIQVAEAIADQFKIPINTLVVKKLPIPDNPEAGFGAIAGDGSRVLSEETVSYLRLPQEEIDFIANKVIQEIKHRIEAYGKINPEEVKGSDAIIVDDGVATGYSMIAALKSVRSMNPASITAAVPVSSQQAFLKLSKYADNVICPMVKGTYFFAVANYYLEWFDLSEEQIKSILNRYRNKYQNL